MRYQTTMRQQGEISETSKVYYPTNKSGADFAAVSMGARFSSNSEFPENGKDSVAYMFVERHASVQCLHPDSIRERSRAADLPFSRAGNHNLLLI